MTTVLNWISRSLRMLGAIGTGEIAAGQEAKDALEAVNGLILGLPEIGLAPTLTEVIISADYTAGEDERIVNNGGYAVTLPTTIDDCGETRSPLNGARVVVVAAGVATTSIYLSNSGWETVSGLKLTDTAPLGPEVYTGLCGLLAVHLAPEYGVEPNATVVGFATGGRTQIADQFQREVEVTGPDEFSRMSDMGIGGDFYDSPIIALPATSGFTGPAPVNQVPVSILGTLGVNETLTGFVGTWSNGPISSYAWTWYRNGAPIGGAEASTYTTVEADAEQWLSVVVEATGPGGVTAKASVAVQIPAIPAEEEGGILDFSIDGNPLLAVI